MSRPLQLIAVSLPPGGGPAGRIMAEVNRLQAGGGVRVVDMLLVSKDREANVVQASFGGDDDFGQLVAQLFPLGGADAPRSGPPAELWAQAESIPAGTAAAFLLVEHRWARGIFDLIDDEGGELLGAAFLTPDLGLVIDAEITAMEDAARSIAAAQEAEADAWMRAIAAQAEAEQAVAESAWIQSAAAARALRVLTDAGLIERAAANEAADALTAAGLVVVAADDATDQALADDAATVAAADDATDRALADDAAAVTAADQRRADAATAASITPAELRVLRYLPTKLTFALIADKLGISRDAAKNRAERAYKRLGVHNRADAVERARALRVLP